MTNPFITANTDILIGKYFHTFRHEDGCGCRRVQWQGKVMGKASATVYLVQLFDWILGDPNSQTLMTLEGLIQRETEFYDSADEMNNCYYRSHDDDCRHWKQLQELKREATERDITVYPSELRYDDDGQRWWLDLPDKICTTSLGNWREFPIIDTEEVRA